MCIALNEAGGAGLNQSSGSRDGIHSQRFMRLCSATTLSAAIDGDLLSVQDGAEGLESQGLTRSQPSGVPVMMQVGSVYVLPPSTCIPLPAHESCGKGGHVAVWDDGIGWHGLAIV